MALKIIWSLEAEETFESVIGYLEEHWSEKEVRNFVRTTNTLVGQIEKFPYQYKSSSFHEMRKAVITKHNSLIYHVNEKAGQIELYTFWDNRKDPKKFNH